MSRIIGIFLAAFIVGGTFAQQDSGRLQGVVTDSSGLPLAGALVELRLESDGQQGLTARTDSEGVFVFSGVPEGRYALSVSAVAFEQVSRAVRIHPATPTTVSVEMAVDAVRSQVTVRAEPPPSLQAEELSMYEASKSVTSIEGEAVMKNNPVNNYDALRYLPGVSTAAFGGRDRFSVPSNIRGNGAWGKVETIDEYPAVQITPVSAEDGGYTAGFSSIIPSVAVEEMTLATGGLGVVYGQSSGGVVKSRIKTGNPTAPHATLRAEGVGVGELVGMGDVSGGLDRLDYYLSGQTVGADYGTSFDTFPRPIQGLRSASGLGKVGYRVSDKGRLEGMFVGGDERHTFFQMGSSPEGDPLRRDYATAKDNYFWAGRYDHRFRPDLAFSSGLTHNRFHENRVEEFAGGVPVGVSRRNRPQRATTAFANITWQTTLSQNVRYAGSAGSEVRRDRFADITNQPIEFDFGEDAVYFRNSVSWSGLTLNGGVRGTSIDNSFETDGRAAYDAGLAYRLPSRTSLKASYSTGYRLNKPFYLWWGGGQNITREPATGLRPSTTSTTELGIEQAFVASGRISGTVRASVFRTDERDLFNFANTGTGVPYYDQLRVDGFELWSQWEVGRVRPFVSYTWLDNARTGSDNPSAANVDLRFAPLPSRSAGFGAMLSASRWLDFSMLGSYDSGGIQQALVNDQIVITRYGAFFKLNAQASLNLSERWSLLVRAENLLNRHDLGYSRSVQQMDGSADRVDGVQRDPGLIVAGGVQWRF